jgi:hypothetical protein
MGVVVENKSSYCHQLITCAADGWVKYFILNYKIESVNVSAFTICISELYDVYTCASDVMSENGAATTCSCIYGFTDVYLLIYSNHAAFPGPADVFNACYLVPCWKCRNGVTFHINISKRTGLWVGLWVALVLVVFEWEYDYND